MFRVSEYITHCSSYKILDPDKTLDDYKHSVATFLMYIKKLKPKPTLKIAGASLLKYQTEWVNFISDLLNKNPINYNKKFKKDDDFLHTSYEKILEMLNIPNKMAVVSEQHLWSKSIWGPIFWEFLHLTSIMCHTKKQMECFAYLMMNFNILLPCFICASNYIDKQPTFIANVIIKDCDPITVMYDLHNTVNVSQNIDVFPYKSFLEKYNIEPKKECVEHHYTLLEL